MRIYHSICPGCGQEIERAYGQMGEGLLYEKGCRCTVSYSLGDCAAIALVLVACVVMIISWHGDVECQDRGGTVCQDAQSVER